MSIYLCYLLSIYLCCLSPIYLCYLLCIYLCCLLSIYLCCLLCIYLSFPARLLPTGPAFAVSAACYLLFPMSPLSGPRCRRYLRPDHHPIGLSARRGRR